MMQTATYLKTSTHPPEATDPRFKKLVPADDWRKLPAAIQRRFTKQVIDSTAVIYRGKITDMRMSVTGRCLAHLLRLIAAPLPLHADIGTPSVVGVMEDFQTGGQIWTRVYAHRSGFPQVVHSAKRFEGPTGLIEYIGYGLAIALKVSASQEGLTSKSAGYHLKFWSLDIKLPRWLTPFDLTVEHRNDTDTTFVFSLNLEVPLLGELINQEGLYEDDH